MVSLPRPHFRRHRPSTRLSPRPSPDFCLSDLARPNQCATGGLSLPTCAAQIKQLPSVRQLSASRRCPMKPPTKLPCSPLVAYCCCPCRCNSCSCKPQQRQLSVRLLHKHPESKVLKGVYVYVHGGKLLNIIISINLRISERSQIWLSQTFLYFK